MNKDITRGTIEMSAAMLISGTIGWFVVISGQPVFMSYSGAACLPFSPCWRFAGCSAC
jgi:hypothetical protein